MSGLCPICGFPKCEHTAFDRGQSLRQLHEDRTRIPTDNERSALLSGDQEAMIEAAQEVARLRRVGKFQPRFEVPEDMKTRKGE